MASPLSGSLQRSIGTAMRGLFIDAVLVKDVVPASPAYDPADPPAAVPASYACKAVVQSYSDHFRASGIVTARDRKVLILAYGLDAEPAPQDRVTVSGITFTLSEVTTDPANAVWECRGAL